MVKFVNESNLRRIVKKIQDSISEKQDTLVSGTNVKTLNGASLLGSGDVTNKVIATITQMTPIGGGSPTYSVSPNFSTILNKINAGFEVVCKYGTYVYQLESYDNSSIRFSLTDAEDGAVETFEVTSSGVTFYSSSFQSYEHLVVNEDPTGGSQTIANPELLNKIESISTTQSTASGGTNTVTITETNGTSTSFNVLNGINGGSLGDVDIVDVTGNRTDAVMSQKGVTEQVERVSQQDLTALSEWTKSKLTSEGWLLGKYLASNNSTGTNSAYCVTPMIELGDRAGHSLTYYYAYAAYSSACMIVYTPSGTKVSHWVTSSNNSRTFTPTAADLGSATQVRMTLNVNAITSCYLYDNTSKEYIFRGVDYISNLCNNKLIEYDFLRDYIIAQGIGAAINKTISQKVITDELSIASTSFKTFTHVGGTLAYVPFSTFPQYDLRNCEGISYVCDGDTVNVSPYTNADIFYCNNGTTRSSTNPLFGFYQGYGTIYGGLIQAESGTRIYNGCGTSIACNSYAHLVITFRFSTGEMCIYKNGVLLSSSTPANYNAETVASVIASSIGFYVRTPSGATRNQYTTAGVAIFGHVLSASEVSSIFGGGCESVKGIIVPKSYEAYNIKPFVFPTFSIRCHNQSTYYTITTDAENGGYILTTKANQTYIGIAFQISTSEQFSNKCRREFDFTILAGTMKYTQTQYEGNNYTILTITNNNGEDVTSETLSEGTYHASCVPTIDINPKNDEAFQVQHKFTTALNTSVRIHPTYKITEMGAGVICSLNTYRNLCWEQKDNSRIPAHSNIIVYNDIYKGDTIKYSSGTLPQFNGQMAVDSTNGKIYVGYLTGTGGTWKQINNS